MNVDERQCKCPCVVLLRGWTFGGSLMVVIQRKKWLILAEFNEERKGDSTFLVEICQKLQKPTSVQDFDNCSLLQCFKAWALHRRKIIIKRKKQIYKKSPYTQLTSIGETLSKARNRKSRVMGAVTKNGSSHPRTRKQKDNATNWELDRSNCHGEK